MALHSKIGASSSERWMKCPGSVRLSEGMPNKSSVFAAEGTAAHEVAALCLKTKVDPIYLFRKFITVEEHSDADSTNVIEVTLEMVGAVREYIKAIRADAEGHKEVITEVEIGFDLGSYYPGLFGTSDCIQWFPEISTLKVYDFKYGAGIAVSPIRNTQLMYYALGALDHFKFPAEEIELVIVQPRCADTNGDVVRRWGLSSLELLDFAADLVDAAKRTQEVNAPLVDGEHCRFCPASGVCPKITKRAQEVAKIDFAAPANYDPQKLADTLQWLPVLEGWIKNVRSFAYSEAESGKDIPGWKLVEKAARRKFKDGIDEELAVALGVELVDIQEKPKLKGLMDIEKLAPGKNAKERAKVLEPFVTKESTGLSLVPDTDNRRRISGGAKSDFEVIND